MRYVKWVLIVAFAVLAAAELILNIAVLGQDLIFSLTLPGYPLGYLLMPLWAALLIVFAAGFALAVFLELGAWYQYSRTIRLQRQQIKGLQAEMEKAKPATTGN